MPLDLGAGDRMINRPLSPKRTPLSLPQLLAPVQVMQCSTLSVALRVLAAWRVPDILLRSVLGVYPQVSETSKTPSGRRLP